MTPEKRRASPWVEASLLLTVAFFGTNFVAIKHIIESVPVDHPEHPLRLR